MLQGRVAQSLVMLQGRVAQSLVTPQGRVAQALVTLQGRVAQSLEGGWRTKMMCPTTRLTTWREVNWKPSPSSMSSGSHSRSSCSIVVMMMICGAGTFILICRRAGGSSASAGSSTARGSRAARTRATTSARHQHTLNTKAYSSTDLAMGFADVRAGTHATQHKRVLEY